MRPINLIPPEDRRGDSAPLRTGPLPYILLAALVALLLGVTAIVIANNQIAESKNEVAQLEGEDAVASAKAQRLASYTQFRTMSEQRVETVSSLADSRFDWERVMRELSLVLPQNVWLVGLTATAAPGVNVQGGSGTSNMRAAIAGPALELTGCAHGQRRGDAGRRPVLGTSRRKENRRWRRRRRLRFQRRRVPHAQIHRQVRNRRRLRRRSRERNRRRRSAAGRNRNGRNDQLGKLGRRMR